MNIFYVYILFRPWDGSPFYVGKGKGARWLKFNRPDNRHFRAILKKARRLGLEVPSVKIRDGLAEDEALSLEMIFIAAIGRGKKGPLVNLTDGGDGVSGRTVSQEERIQKRIQFLGKPLSPEHREAIRAAQKGRKYTLGHTLTTEHKAKIGAASRGNKHNLGRRLTDGHRKKISRSVKKTLSRKRRLDQAELDPRIVAE